MDWRPQPLEVLLLPVLLCFFCFLGLLAFLPFLFFLFFFINFLRLLFVFFAALFPPCALFLFLAGSASASALAEWRQRTANNTDGQLKCQISIHSYLYLLEFRIYQRKVSEEEFCSSLLRTSLVREMRNSGDFCGSGAARRLGNVQRHRCSSVHLQDDA